MITKDQFITSLQFEINIVKHLFTKIPEHGFDYRPSDHQRSTMELLRYIALIGASMLDLIRGNGAAFDDFDSKGGTITRDNFLDILEDEEKKIVDLLSTFTEEELAEEVEIFGFLLPKSIHLLNILKWVTAYKMQLFLYIKASGVHNISTSNVWGGKDMPNKTDN